MAGALRLRAKPNRGQTSGLGWNFRVCQQDQQSIQRLRGIKGLERSIVHCLESYLDQWPFSLRWKVFHHIHHILGDVKASAIAAFKKVSLFVNAPVISEVDCNGG